ncbi:hypothetical protein [[Mycobacterium] burgundiense]|uniref:Response regulator receiver protein n=1 Tax=[Mycobacterium] burgundiense TaxID=3064286 RepID=A0ABM9LNX6_9MYCO|nr:hypothetical protein [Mycolicibacterium sp. MU0053]CAJ1502231.1 hypothetical protein MU0053_002128 [Mycolicibacterium sp. MU0053]
MFEDELDALYAGRPEDFVALRNELAAAAKARGEPDRARLIRAARKPTVAAWVVNRLVHTNPDARRALTDLGERLRTAHTEMDGAAIRRLSTEQRGLVNELVRAGFDAAELPRPSEALLDDVAGTLHAAIADAELAAQLGRLSKPLRWSGFGEFLVGEVAEAESAIPDTTPEEAAADACLGAKIALADAKRAHTEAERAASRLRDELREAEHYLDALRKQLPVAEAELAAITSRHDQAEQRSREAAQTLKDLKARVRELSRQ